MIRRVRAHAGIWALIALLGLGAVFLLGATPRAVGAISDTALRRMVAEPGYLHRELIFAQRSSPTVSPDSFRSAAAAQLPAALGRGVTERWGYAETTFVPFSGGTISTTGCAEASILHHTDLGRGVTLTSGRLPQPVVGHGIEVIVSAATVDRLGLRVGTEYLLGNFDPLAVVVVGLYTAVEPASPVWAPHPSALSAQVIETDACTVYRFTALTDVDGFRTLALREYQMQTHTRARFRLDDRLLDSRAVATLGDSVRSLRTSRSLANERMSVDTRFDKLLDRYSVEAAAVRALLAVVLASLAGAAVGLLALAARLAVDRRRTELTLLRSRGASLARVGRRLAGEAATLLVPAVVAGWAAAVLVPASLVPAALVPSGTGGAVLTPGAGATPVLGGLMPVALALLVTVAAVPAAGIVLARGRVPLARIRRARRLTVELLIVALAVLGVVLLRRRGLPAQGIDPFLVAVPVLVGTAAGVVGLRLYPAPLRLLGYLLRRRRGATIFLGLARAGRPASGDPVTLPLVVLVLVVALGGFVAAVRTGIDQARHRAALADVGADFRLTAARFDPGAAVAVAAVPGVTAVVPASRIGGRALLVGEHPQLDDVGVIAIDPSAYRRLLRSYGSDIPAMSGEGHEYGPVPALASPALAARLAGAITPGAAITPGVAALALAPGDGPPRPVVVVGTVEHLPGLDRRQREFLLVPRSAFRADDVPVTDLLVAGPAADPALLQSASAAAAVVTLAGRRKALAESGFNDGIALAFGVGLAGAVAAGLLALALILVAGARARGRDLSLLCTLGMSDRLARAVLLIELAPLLAIAVLTGVGTGTVLPALLAPALRLEAFTGGTPVRPELSPSTVAAALGLLVVLLVAAATTEVAVNRRLGLGRVLRA